jgi:YHS domain-containing protein
MLSAATGLVILPSMNVEVRAEIEATDSSFAETSGEPRRLIERPATRAAISTSKPARSLFPSLFSSKTASEESSIQLPPAAPDDDRSEVQRHLDELYRREGRDAPSLDIGQPASTRLSQSTQPLSKSSAGPASGSGSIQQVASNPFKRFFQKITPFRRSQDPNDERPKNVEPLSAAARQEQLRLQQTPVERPVAMPARNLEPMPIPMSIDGVAARPALPLMDLLVPPPPAPAESKTETQVGIELPAAPAFAETAGSITKGADAVGKLPEFLPAVELPQIKPQILSTGLTDEPIGSKAKAVVALPENDDLLGNPFPELSESEADGTPKVAKPAVVVEKGEAKKPNNPFNGLKLDTEPAAAVANQVQQAAADSVPLPKLPDLPAPAALATPDSATPAGKLPEIMPAERPVVKAADSKGAHGDKLQKIAERSELTGLKGFCPVALRDSRELKDARPQFQAKFNGKIYNLSSAEAKAKFESDPDVYAPAAGGQDVVLAASEATDREGSLDRAVWYRNRLYLFSSKESHEEFVASPATFAVDNADDE